MPSTRRRACLCLRAVLMLAVPVFTPVFAQDPPGQVDPAVPGCGESATEATTEDCGVRPVANDGETECVTLVECDEDGICVTFCAGCVDPDGSVSSCPHS